MDLSRQLLKDFADVTRGVERDQTQYLRGTIKGSGEAKYVRIDGSESLTPISEIVDVQEGDRVLVTIENHEATILGNLTKPPSAYKEQEAIDKAEDAQNSANAAGEAAEDAKSLAQSAGNKADAAVVDATNASASANQAKQDAAAAMTAAENASKNSTEAKELATAAGQNATTAREEAAAAQNAATAAQGEVTRIEGVVTGVKGNIDTALREVADQAADLQATKETLEVTYAKKTEVSDVQAALTTEISKKVGELQTTVSQTYAAKNDVVAMEGRLQSQITQTSGEVSSVVGKVEQLESDTTEAKKKVDEALEKSAAAQVAAGQAQANATAAQTAADAAKVNADNATKKANEAVQNAANAAATAAEADRKVSAAKTDLDEAKVNLENTMNRVGATEQEIADAQKKVDAAQAAVTQAQIDAAEATAAANNAQNAANKAQTDATEAQNSATNAQKKADNAALAAGNAQAAADKAQQDVAALTKRVTSAETAITQNTEQIKLSATKTEEIGTKLDNLQVGGRNLLLHSSVSTDNLKYFNTQDVTVEVVTDENIKAYKITAGNKSGLGKGAKYTSNIGVKNLLADRTYTFSFWLKSSVVDDFSFGSIGHYQTFAGSEIHVTANKIYKPSTIQANVWTKASITFYVIKDCYFVPYFMYLQPNQVIYIYDIMLEEGNTPTPWSPALEDQQSQIDGINNNLTNNYYSKTQTDAAIKVAADNVTTTVRTETTKQITNINIGERNLLLNSGREYKNNHYAIARYYISPSEGDVLTDGHGCLITGKEYTVTCCLTPDDTMTHIWFYVSDGWRKLGEATVKNNSTKQIVNTTFTAEYYDGYTPSDDPLNAAFKIYRYPNPGNIDNEGNVTIHWLKVVEGNKSSKSWSPAIEEMATEDEVQQAQDYANEANGKADATENRVTVAESTIKQLSDSIAMLVTDSNGSSMMTQTSNGWTFNISSITDSLNNAVNNLDNLTSSVEQSNSTLNNLKQLADDLSNKTAYINMSTDEITGLPCIELGKGGDPFKVRITNRSVDFMDGESKIAYVSNQTLYINQAVVRNEFMIGDGKGFVFKTRSNGNMGLRWSTMSRIFITRYTYNQSQIDTYSKAGYSKTWGVWESVADVRYGDIVKIGVLNTDTNRYNYIEAKVTAQTTTSLTCTSTGIVTTY